MNDRNNEHGSYEWWSKLTRLNLKSQIKTWVLSVQNCSWSTLARCLAPEVPQLANANGIKHLLWWLRISRFVQCFHFKMDLCQILHGRRLDKYFSLASCQTSLKFFSKKLVDSFGQNGRKHGSGPQRKKKKERKTKTKTKVNKQTKQKSI